MRPIIFAIVGPSGCGKTTLVEHLKEELGIPVVVSYTTRPMRSGETDGVEHHFVTEDEMPPADEMLAYTQFGGYHYWTEYSQISSDMCLYIIDEIALDNMMKKDRVIKNYAIIPILIQRDENKLRENIDSERLKRDKSRITFPKSFYDTVIYNDSTLEEFLNISTNLFKTNYGLQQK